MLRNIKSITEDWMLGEIRNANSNFRALTMCKTCHTFYYGRSWHFERPEYLDDYSEQEVPVRFTECPSCVEEKLASYDAESLSILAGI